MPCAAGELKSSALCPTCVLHVCCRLGTIVDQMLDAPAEELWQEQKERWQATFGDESGNELHDCMLSPSTLVRCTVQQAVRLVRKLVDDAIAADEVSNNVLAAGSSARASAMAPSS